jgi:hypothetical protein
MANVLHDRRGRVSAGKGLGKPRTDTLLSQPETGKISCVHHLPYARLSPGALPNNCRGSLCVPMVRTPTAADALLRSSFWIRAVRPHEVAIRHEPPKDGFRRDVDWHHLANAKRELAFEGPATEVARMRQVGTADISCHGMRAGVIARLKQISTGGVSVS